MPEVIAIVRVAAVDHDVTGLQRLRQPLDHLWVIVPAGTITQTIRGVDSFSTNSTTEYTPVVLSSLGQGLDGGRVVVVHDTFMSVRGHAADDVPRPSGPGRSFLAASLLSP